MTAAKSVVVSIRPDSTGYECPVCSKPQSSRVVAISHAKSVHRINPVAASGMFLPTKGKPIVSCSVCGYICSAGVGFARHSAIHGL